MSKIPYPTAPVLLVDDEAPVLDSVLFSLRFAGIHAQTCCDSRKVIDTIQHARFSVIVLDLLMPHMTGYDLLPLIRDAAPETPIIIMTAVNEVESAVRCMKEGAFDYLLKPIQKEALIASVRKAIDLWDMQTENARLKEKVLTNRLERPEAFEPIVTRSPAMHAIFRYIDAIAATPLPVLITGETGAGKELFAKAVHDASGRTGEFVAVNIAGLDDSLFADTLFGHTKGAFTGAAGERKGLIKQASGGTLFLDEIGDLPRESQVKLLRLLEDRTYYPVGADLVAHTDARIVAATNKTIEELQRDDNFRKDLFFRLRTHHVHIPPLRERKEDVPLLIDFFIEQAADQLSKEPPTAPPQIATMASAYHFPGNVRELRGLIFDAVGRHQAGVLSLDSIRRATIGQHTAPKPDAGQSQKIFFSDELPSLKEMEQALIDEAMKRAQGNQTIAAQLLGFTRSALNKRLNKK